MRCFADFIYVPYCFLPPLTVVLHEVCCYSVLLLMMSSALWWTVCLTNCHDFCICNCLRYMPSFAGRTCTLKGFNSIMTGTCTR